MRYIEIPPDVEIEDMLPGTPSMRADGQRARLAFAEFFCQRLLDRKVHRGDMEGAVLVAECRDALAQALKELKERRAYVALPEGHWERIKDATVSPSPETAYGPFFFNFLPFMRAIKDASTSPPAQQQLFSGNGAEQSAEAQT